MKALVLTLALALTSTMAFAGQFQYEKAAKNAVVDMFGRKGDVVNASLKKLENSEESTTEVWEVTLSNGANTGSATYEVSVTASDSGKFQGMIKIRYVDGT